MSLLEYKKYLVTFHKEHKNLVFDNNFIKLRGAFLNNNPTQRILWNTFEKIHLKDRRRAKYVNGVLITKEDFRIIFNKLIL